MTELISIDSRRLRLDVAYGLDEDRNILWDMGPHRKVEDAVGSQQVGCRCKGRQVSSGSLRQAQQCGCENDRHDSCGIHLQPASLFQFNLNQ